MDTFRAIAFVTLILLNATANAKLTGLSVTASSWSENLNLASSLGNYQMKGTFVSAGLGYEWWQLSKERIFTYGLQVFAGQMNVSEASKEVQYFKKGNPLFGVQLHSAYLIRNQEAKSWLNYGPYLSAAARYVPFGKPSSDSEFEEKMRIIAEAGAQLSLRLNRELWARQQLSFLNYGIDGARWTFWLVYVY